MEIVHVYQKKRREFGRQCTFADRRAEIIVDIEPEPSLRDDFIYKNPAEVAIQCSSEFSEHEVRYLPGFIQLRANGCRCRSIPSVQSLLQQA